MSFTGSVLPPFISRVIQGRGLSGSIERRSKLENCGTSLFNITILREGCEERVDATSLGMLSGKSTTIGGPSSIEITHLIIDSIAASPRPLVSSKPEVTVSVENRDCPQSCLNLLQVESSVFERRLPSIRSFNDWHLLTLSESDSRG